MIYEFESIATGKIAELAFSASEVPEPGQIVNIAGRRYRRIMSVPQVSAGVANICHGYPYVSNSMPRGAGLAKHAEMDKRGRPIVRSRLHEKELCAVLGRIRD